MAKISLNSTRFNPEEMYTSKKAHSMSKKNSLSDGFDHHTIRTKKAPSRFLTKSDLKSHLRDED